ncbi:MAG: cation:proton antiporter, partial [Oscillospiraceae bacterium]|nr:cation:proton antiporter [Oscillospiraceae bacterium]
MEILIQLSLSLVGGLLMSRLAKRLNLPAVTAYLIAGLLLGPYCLGALNLFHLGFSSAQEVASLDIVSQVALGFIAFTIGNEFRLEQLKHMGRQAITVGILQAVITTVLVDAALVVLHFINPALISISSAITLGAIAAATAPAATLMVVRQYKADGPLTKLLLLVVAIDDAVGLVLFSASFGVAAALESGTISMVTVLVEPLVEIALSLGLGALAGWLLFRVEKY